GDVLLAEEAAGGIPPRHRIERDLARPAMAGRAGLVEADMPRSANPENLQVDAARSAYLLLVLGAEVLHGVFRNRAVRDVDVLRLDVDVIEERFLHPAPIAVRAVRLHGVI